MWKNYLYKKSTGIEEDKYKNLKNLSHKKRLFRQGNKCSQKIQLICLPRSVNKD